MAFEQARSAAKAAKELLDEMEEANRKLEVRARHNHMTISLAVTAVGHLLAAVQASAVIVVTVSGSVLWELCHAQLLHCNRASEQGKTRL